MLPAATGSQPTPLSTDSNAQGYIRPHLSLAPCMPRPTHVPLAGRFTFQQLLDAGATRSQVQTWLQHGAITRLARNVYTTPTSEPPQRHIATQIRGAVLDGRVPVPTLEAAKHHELWLPRQIPTELRSADGRRVLPPECVHEHNGLLVPCREWTAVQVARWQDLSGALPSLDSALRFGADRNHMLDHAVEMRRWPGSRLLRRAIDAADPRSESALESCSRGLMIVAGLPTPELQYEVDVQGYQFRVDFAFVEARVIGESDGIGKYGPEPTEALRLEKRRQTLLQSAGFTVVRWTWADLYPDPVAWIRAMQRALRRHH